MRAAENLGRFIPVYFCDPKAPGSPWQRGSNENTNRLLHQYYPKRADLSGVNREHLAAGRRRTQRPATNDCPATLRRSPQVVLPGRRRGHRGLVSPNVETPTAST